MSDPYHERITKIFLHAIELTEAEREPYLDRACAGDSKLRDDFDSLLRHDADSATILGPAAALSLAETIEHPRSVGPYQILEPIGEGGMGVVYRAQQVHPFKRQVALKLIKLGLDTRDVVSRFESERQVLALMDHPNIAKILDAGVSETGQPYFAMEFIDGESITSFCDGRRMTVEARLRLFLDACEGVVHAHQNGVIHRDIKPSNILVTTRASSSIVKVIDFGVAKALSSAGASHAHTATGVTIGTPNYMSPEQAAGAPNIDTRTDVYSLGVLLYELLVGEPPALSSASPEQQNEPRSPAAHVSRLREKAGSIASARASDSSALVTTLRGDLSWIVLKTLESDRERRYPGVPALANDVRRFLQHQPIEARPPTLAYRLGKAVRRNRAASVLAGSLALVLVSGSGALLLQSRQIASERDRAEEISEALVGLYEIPFFLAGRQERPTGVAILHRGASQVDERLGARPVLQARMLMATGVALRSVGETDRALTLLERAQRGLADSLGEDHPRTLRCANELAQAYADDGRIEKSAALLRDTLDRQRQVLGDKHIDVSRSMRDLGALNHLNRMPGEAVLWLEESFEGMREVLGADHPETLSSASLLAAAYLDLRRLDDADELLTDTLLRMTEDHVERIFVFFNFACVHALRGEQSEAIKRLRQAVDKGFRNRLFAYPELESLFDDPAFIEVSRRAHLNGVSQLRWINHRATIDVAYGDYSRAEAIFLELIEKAPSQRRRGFVSSLAWTRLRAGRYDDALAGFEEFLDGAESAPDFTEGKFILNRWYHAQALIGSGQPEAAAAALEEVDRRIGDGPLFQHMRHHALADLAALRGNTDAALDYLELAVAYSFFEPDQLEHDIALIELREHPRFEAILRKLKRRYSYPSP